MSLKHILVLVFAALLALSFVSAHGGHGADAEDIPEPEGSKVVILNAENFSENVLKGDQKWIVEFYAAWCPHCKKLAPIFTEAAGKLSDKVAFGKVDCSKGNDELCQKYDVKGFPTMKYFDADSVLEYNGAREVAGFVDYVNKMSRPALTEIKSEEELKSFLNDKHGAFLFFGSDRKDLAEAVAKKFRTSMDFALVTDDKLRGKFGVTKVPALVSLHDDMTSVYQDAFTKDKLSEFVNANRFGLLTKLGPENFPDFHGAGLPLLIAVVKPSVEERTAAQKDAATDSAKKFRGKVNFVWLDGEQYQSYVEGTYKVPAEKYPVAILLDATNNQYFLLEEQSDEQDVLTKFVNDALNGSIKPVRLGPEPPSVYEQYISTAKEYLVNYLWYSLAGIFVLGIVLGRLTVSSAPAKVPKKKTQ